MHLVMRPCTVSNSSRLCSRHEFVLGPRRSLRGNLIHPMHVSQSSVPRHQDLFLKVATIGFRSEINPPMLRTWLLGKEKLFVRDGHACVAQLVYDGPGSYQTNHSRCTITTCSTKLIGPVQSAFITQGFNWQFDCFLLIWQKPWMHILIDFVHGLTSFRLLRHAR